MKTTHSLLDRLVLGIWSHCFAKLNCCVLTLFRKTVVIKTKSHQYWLFSLMKIIVTPGEVQLSLSMDTISFICRLQVAFYFCFWQGSERLLSVYLTVVKQTLIQTHFCNLILTGNWEVVFLCPRIILLFKCLYFNMNKYNLIILIGFSLLPSRARMLPLWPITNEYLFTLLTVCRLRVVPHFSSGIVERATRLFWCGVIFTRARVSLALLSLTKNGGLLVV